MDAPRRFFWTTLLSRSCYAQRCIIRDVTSAVRPTHEVAEVASPACNWGDPSTAHFPRFRSIFRGSEQEISKSEGWTNAASPSRAVDRTATGRQREGHRMAAADSSMFWSATARAGHNFPSNHHLRRPPSSTGGFLKKSGNFPGLPVVLPANESAASRSWQAKIKS